MIEAHLKLQQSPPEPGCELERVIASLMFWSDSTHLASFGTASLWPVYLFFGNQTKSLRCKPHTASCHHIAYIPKVWLMFYSFWSDSWYQMSDIATTWVSWFFLCSDRWSTNSWHSNSLSAWSDACNLGVSAGWRIFACLWTWNNYWMPWWDLSPILSSNFYLFCRLPRKVS